MPTVRMIKDTGEKVPVDVTDDTYQQIQAGDKRFVLVKNSYGIYVPMEVSEAVYQLFEEEYRFHERMRNERRAHQDGRGLEDYEIICQAVSEGQEEAYLRRERLAAVYAVLQSCTSIQRERFFLNRICGYKCSEIAKIQESSPRRVRRSVEAVLKKIKENF